MIAKLRRGVYESMIYGTRQLPKWPKQVPQDRAARWKELSRLLIVLLMPNVPPSDDQRRAERIVGLLKLGRHFTQCANMREFIVVVY